MPTALAGSDPGCDTQINEGAITYGSGCTGAEAGSLNGHLETQYGGITSSPFINSRTSGNSIVGDRWLGSNGPSGRHKYRFGAQGNLSFCGAGRCDIAYVWPVHDGDIGVAATPPTLADSLLPRDLDGDSSTIEAYYFVPLDITWLADTNLGKSNTFSLRGGDFTEDGSEVNENGLLFTESLPAFIGAVNQNSYLGYSNWRLPTAMPEDPGCQREAELLGLELEGMTAFGSNCRGAEIGEFNQFIIANTASPQEYPFTSLATQRRVWLGSNGPGGRHHFFFGVTDRGEIGDLGMCPGLTGTRHCQPAAVWLVHNGDIGTGPQPDTGNVDSNGASGGGSLGVLGLLLGMSLLQRRRPQVQVNN